MIEKFKDWFKNLNSKQKRGVIGAALAVTVIALALSVRQGQKPNDAELKAKAEAENLRTSQVVELGINSDHLQTSAYMQSRKEMESLKKELEDLKNGKTPDPKAMGDKPGDPSAAAPAGAPATGAQSPLATFLGKNDAGAKPVKMPEAQLPAPAAAKKDSGKKSGNKAKGQLPPVPSMADLPGASNGSPMLPPPPPGMSVGSGSGLAGAPQLEEKQIGGIAFVSNSTKSDKSDKNDDSDKKKEEKIFLPPSFMTATMLSGLDAPTSSGGSTGKGGPVPVLLRIKDLSVLPNKVKANLKGCFVIAEGVGNLSSERAELRLVSLTCLDRKSQAVIDQDISGFIVDTDGKIGLRGRVVATKLGSTIARSMLAGFFGGLGDGLKSSVTSTSVLPTGAVSGVQNIDAKALLSSGLGQGVSNAASEMQKFYMELARSSMPVIEVGATREITIVVNKGVDLVLKDMCSGGRKCK